MPKIIPSASLRNNYKKISAMAKKSGEPIYLTVNGKGDLVLMSLDAYDKMAADIELLLELGAAQRDIDAGNVSPFDDKCFESLQKELDEQSKK
jgi:prevent-host-death family protein